MGDAGERATAVVLPEDARSAPNDDPRRAGYVAARGREALGHLAAATLLTLLVSACAPTTGGRAATRAGASSNASPATTAPATPGGSSRGMLVRISEIEIDPDQLAQYRAILKEEAEASVRLEPGVVAIFPMYRRDDPAEVRILEIYASRAAYEAHLKTPHFARYKTTTLPMVKALRLVDMETIDPASMPRMFGKLRGGG